MYEHNFQNLDKDFYPITEMFEKVSENNYLQFVQIANILYHNILFSDKSSEGHIVNWVVNFGNLHDFISDNYKTGKDIMIFLDCFEESAPLLFQKLGL